MTSFIAQLGKAMDSTAVVPSEVKKIGKEKTNEVLRWRDLFVKTLNGYTRLAKRKTYLALASFSKTRRSSTMRKGAVFKSKAHSRFARYYMKHLSTRRVQFVGLTEKDFKEDALVGEGKQ
eukprot:1324364-Rhodomonas_salina.1